MTLFFNIYDLIGVNVANEVNPLIVKSLDSYMGFFRQNEQCKTPYQITINPYNDLKIEQSNAFASYMQQDIFISSKDKIAIKKQIDGYIVYAEIPNVPISLLIQLLLIRNDIVALHCAATVENKYNDRENTILVGGVAGTGKTSILVHLVRSHGYYMLGDDYTLLKSDGTCLSFLKTDVSIKEFNGTKSTLSSPLFRRIIFNMKRFLISNAPFRGIAEKFIYNSGLIGSFVRMFSVREHLEKPTIKVYGEENILESGKLEQVIYLEKWSGEYELYPVTEMEMCNRLMSSVHLDRVSSYRILFELSSFGIENYTDYFDHIKKIISSGIFGKKCWVFKVPNKISSEDMHTILRNIL